MKFIKSRWSFFFSRIPNTLAGKIDHSVDDVRSQNREQLIEKLQRVIQEKNASIQKLEER